MVSFFIDLILPIALWSWGRLNLQQKWVPGVFPGGKKRPVGKADNPTIIMGHCHIIWELHLPGTLWAPRACNGTDVWISYIILFETKFIFSLWVEPIMLVMVQVLVTGLAEASNFILTFGWYPISWNVWETALGKKLFFVADDRFSEDSSVSYHTYTWRETWGYMSVSQIFECQNYFFNFE